MDCFFSWDHYPFNSLANHTWVLAGVARVNDDGKLSMDSCSMRSGQGNKANPPEFGARSDAISLAASFKENAADFKMAFLDKTRTLVGPVKLTQITANKLAFEIVVDGLTFEGEFSNPQGIRG